MKVTLCPAAAERLQASENRLLASLSGLGAAFAGAGSTVEKFGAALRGLGYKQRWNKEGRCNEEKKDGSLCLLRRPCGIHKAA